MCKCEHGASSLKGFAFGRFIPDTFARAVTIVVAVIPGGSVAICATLRAVVEVVLCMAAHGADVVRKV